MRRLLLTILSAFWTSLIWAQLPEGLQFDDGFTWIQCHNFEAYVDNKPIGSWVPEITVRVLGKTPDRSGWKFIIKKEGKILAEYLNDGFPVQLVRGETIGLNIFGFWKDKSRITEHGLMDLEVYYIDGKTDKEFLAKTLKLDIRRLEKERGSVGQRDAGPPGFYVNRHSEILSSILYCREKEFPSYTQFGGPYYSDRVVELVVNYSENEKFSGPKLGRLRVEVDGKEIEMSLPGNNVPQDKMGLGTEVGKFADFHSDRAADKYFKSGPAYKEYIGFARRSLLLPLHWGPKPVAPFKPSAIYTTDFPGDWKITWIIDRVPVRIYRFKIDKNGLPLPHPEQEKGLCLAPHAALVDTEIPKDGAEFDGRISSEFVKAGAFFGRPWATDAMKKAAESVPTKGTPFPVPSDKQ